jgi:hypothetical protein
MVELQNNATHVLPPGEGKSVWLVGTQITVKLESEDTGGAYSVMENISPPEVDHPHIYTTTLTKPYTCWRERWSS